VTDKHKNRKLTLTDIYDRLVKGINCLRLGRQGLIPNNHRIW